MQNTITSNSTQKILVKELDLIGMGTSVVIAHLKKTIPG